MPALELDALRDPRIQRTDESDDQKEESRSFDVKTDAEIESGSTDKEIAPAWARTGPMESASFTVADESSAVPGTASSNGNRFEDIRERTKNFTAPISTWEFDEDDSLSDSDY